MAQFELKSGLGTRVRDRAPIRVYHVVKDGRTIASFTSWNDARNWVAKRYGFEAMRQAILNRKV